MIQEAEVEVRGWTKEGNTPRDGRAQNYFIFVNGRNFLVSTPWDTQWSNVSLDWDGRAGAVDLDDIFGTLPKAIGLNLSPEIVLNSTTGLCYKNGDRDVKYRFDLSTEEDIKYLRAKLIEDPNGCYKFNAGKGINSPTHMAREYFSYMALEPAGENPAAYAYKEEGFPERYSGREMLLVVKGLQIARPLVVWIAEHQADPVGLGAIDQITEAVTQIRATHS